MAVIEDDTFENLDGTPDTDAGDDPGNTGIQAEIDEGFEDLLSASETIEVEGMDPPEEPEATDTTQQHGAAEEDDPDDDSKLSESIKKRIQRAKRVGEWEAEERVREEMSQELTTWKQRAEEAEKRAQQASEQGGNTATASEPAELTAMRDKLKAVKDKRRQAKVEGDVDAEEEADEQVRALDFQIRVLEATLAQQRQRQQRQGNTGTQDAGAARTNGTQPQLQAKQLSDGARTNIASWVERNAQWYGQTGFEEATAKAKEIDKELWAKGYRPEDADYFTELDRRLMKSGVRRPGSTAASGHSAGSNVAPANGGGGDRSRSSNNGNSPSNGGNRVRLSREDVQMMRSLKLDPTNKAVVAEWVRNGRGA